MLVRVWIGGERARKREEDRDRESYRQMARGT